MPTDGTQIDILTQSSQGFTGGGNVAATLLANSFRVEALRTNNVLRKDEWELFDTTVVQIAQERLIGVADLLNAGLRFDLANAMGTTRLEWERMGDMDDAEISMSGLKEGENDRVIFDLASLPIPIIHKDFSINARALAASRNLGQSLDTTQAAAAARLVSERTENLLFNGANVSGTNGNIYGYQTYPDRNTGSVTASWLTATGEQILADVLSMIEDAIADNMYGPYVIYVPNAVLVKLGNDFKANSDKTILQRLKEVPGISDIRPSSKMSTTSVLLIQMTSDVVDMVVGQQPVPIQWDSHGGMKMNFKVMTIMVPRIKSDQSGQCGIVHYS